MSDTKLKNIALVGVRNIMLNCGRGSDDVQGSSKIGTATLKYLLQRNSDIRITIITRDASTATFPSSPQISVKKGSFEDTEFLQSAFRGSELAVLVINVFAMDVEQPRLIDAAAKLSWLDEGVVAAANEVTGRREVDHSQ